MTVTAHTQSVGETFTIADGNQTWASLLAAVYPGMFLGHKRWMIRVESGGPIAIGFKTLAALTDGANLAVGDADSEFENVDGAKINIFGSGAPTKCYISAVNR